MFRKVIESLLKIMVIIGISGFAFWSILFSPIYIKFLLIAIIGIVGLGLMR